MSAPSLAPYILKRPWLQRWVKPLSNWYCNAAGYRQLGLRADDILPEENDVVQTALKRLQPQAAYDRVFRLRRAIQLLPKEEWTKPEEVRKTQTPHHTGADRPQDVPYLQTLIEDIETEMAEREDLEAMVVTKRQRNAQAGH